jgi:hypothetical protein
MNTIPNVSINARIRVMVDMVPDGYKSTLPAFELRKLDRFQVSGHG